jgi:hypothetical protein
MSIVLVGYCNGNKLVQIAFCFDSHWENNAIKLFDGTKSVDVDVDIDDRFIRLCSVDYINGHGVDINIDLTAMTGSFYTGLARYVSGSSGPLEPALIAAAVEFFKG